MPTAALEDLSFGEVLFAVIVFAALSMWVFWHASKHGSRHPTAWGIAVFLIWPVIIVYFVHYFMTRRGRF
jgi:hypothetical protein